MNEVATEKNEAGERKICNFPHASRHELQTVVLRRCCILECLVNTIVNEVAPEKKQVVDASDIVSHCTVTFSNVLKASLIETPIMNHMNSVSENVLEFGSGNDLFVWHALMPQTVMAKLKVAH